MNQSWLLLKYRKDGTRFEIETLNPNSSPEERSALERLSLVRQIEKIRYKVPSEDLTWEIDVYQGENKGLITVDVELPERDYPLCFPNLVNAQWEITGNPKYTNRNLGRRPYSTW